MFGHHQDKGLTELISAIQVTVSLADEFNLLALLLVKLFRLADTQPGGACGRQAAREVRWGGSSAGTVSIVSEVSRVSGAALLAACCFFRSSVMKRRSKGADPVYPPALISA